MRIKLLLLICVFPSLLFASENFTDSSLVVFQHPKHEHSFLVSARIPVGSFGDDYKYFSSNDAAESLSHSI